MRKVTKILGMIVSAAVLLLILLPIFLSLLLSLPIVQRRVVDFATHMLTQQIGSEVSIGRVDVSMKGYLEVEDLLVRDLQADTLLYVNDLKSRISGFSYKENTLRLGHSTIDGAKLNMLERESGEMNVREVVLKLTSQKLDKKALIIEVSEIEVEGFDVTIARLEKLNPEYGVDMRNLVVNDMAAHIFDLMVDGPALHAKIETMSGVEQSGFEVADIGGELYITSGALAITDMKLDSRWSSLRLDHLTIADSDWGAYRDFNNSTGLSFEVSEGYISSDDVAYFAPALRDWGVSLYDLEFGFHGEVNSMELNIENASFGDNTSLSALLECRGITSPMTAKGKLTLNGLTTSATDIDQIVAASTKQGLDEKSLSMLSAFGGIVVRGEASGESSSLKVAAQLESEVGVMSTDMLITRSDTTSMHLSGDLRAEALELGRVLSNNDFGVTTLHGSVDGYVGEEDRDVKIHGEIDEMNWREYPLHNIALYSHVTPNYIGGEVVCRDPKLQFDLTAHGANLLGEWSSYQADLDLKMADLKALHVNRRDTLSILSAKVNISAEGSDVENGEAKVTLESGEYRYNESVIDGANAVVNIASRYNDKTISLVSDFADASFHSSNSVAHIKEYLEGSMAAYLPSLYESPSQVTYNMSTMLSEEAKARRRRVAQSAELNTSGFSELTITAHNLTPITTAISDGLQIGGGTRAALRFNIPRQLFDLELRSGYLERNSLLAIGIDLQASNQGDSVSLRGDVQELFVGTSFIERANLSASARDNQVSIHAGFINPADSAAADFNAKLNIRRNFMGRQDVSARILPSSIRRGNQVWNIGAQGIDITERGVDIDHFKMESRDQMDKDYLPLLLPN